MIVLELRNCSAVVQPVQLQRLWTWCFRQHTVPFVLTNAQQILKRATSATLSTQRAAAKELHRHCNVKCIIQMDLQTAGYGRLHPKAYLGGSKFSHHEALKPLTVLVRDK